MLECIIHNSLLRADIMPRLSLTRLNLRPSKNWFQSLKFNHALLRYIFQWRHNGRDGVSSHQPHDCLLSRLFRRRLKKTSKLLVTGLCAGNSPVTVEFPTQRANNAENVSIWWCHHKNPVPQEIECFWKDACLCTRYMDSKNYLINCLIFY